MRILFAFVFGLFIFAAGTAVNAQPGGARFMAFCTDGDGAVSDWVFPREEAFVLGRDHERSHRGHRWEIFVQQGKVAAEGKSCSAVAENPDRPGTMRVMNTCGACRIFRITRRNADGTVRSKEFKLKPGAQRSFLKREDSVVLVESEFECPDT